MSINIRIIYIFENVENTLLILSEDKQILLRKSLPFVELHDSSIKIYSLYPLKQISELNIETLMKLNVRIPVSNYFDRLHVDNKRFL